MSIELTWGLVADREKQYLHAVGAKGSGTLPPLRVFRESANGLLDVSPQLTQSRENQFTASYRQELAFFIDAVRNEQDIESPSEQVALLSIVEAAYRSAESGAEVIF